MERIVYNPTVENVFDEDVMFFVEHSETPVTKDEMEHFVKGANSVVVLEGKRSGKERLLNAFFMAYDHMNDLAPNHGHININGDRILLLFTTNKNNPYEYREKRILENIYKSTPHVKIHWGYTEDSTDTDGAVNVRMLLAYDSAISENKLSANEIDTLVKDIQEKTNDSEGVFPPWNNVIDSIKEYPQRVRWSDQKCKKCKSPLVRMFFKSPGITWQMSCGRCGEMTICPACIKQIDFDLLFMS